MIWRRCRGLLFALLLVSCHSQNSDVKNAAVLSINGQAYTAADFGRHLAKKLKMFDALAAKDPTNIKKARETVVNELIVSALLTQYGQAHGLSISNEELNNEVTKIRKNYPDDLTFKAALATEGQSITEWKQALLETLTERKVFAALTPSSPSDQKTITQEALSYYNEHKNDFVRPAQIRLQQIIVTRQDDAERILHQIKIGVSFTELAQKFSISPDGAQGGDIGFISKGTMPAFDTAFNLKVGQTSPVVKSSYGFHIMKVLDKRPKGSLSFEQVKAKLVREATARHQQEAFGRWLESAVKSAKIERNDLLLEKVRVRTEGQSE